jgi:hypothetical protein
MLFFFFDFLFFLSFGERLRLQASAASSTLEPSGSAGKKSAHHSEFMIEKSVETFARMERETDAQEKQRQAPSNTVR